MSGASGTPYAAAVLRALLAAGESVDLVVSRASRLTLLDETGIAFRDAHWHDDLREWLSRGADGKPGTFTVDLDGDQDLFAKLGGSFPGARYELRYDADDDTCVALLTEPLVAELLAAEWWQACVSNSAQ